MQPELLSPGFVIAGKYVIERTLGRGGMGAVYVVSHVNTGKRLALKVLLPEFVHNADIVGRFLREAQVMGRLQHRHVIDVFDVGRDGDVLYIVMELLDGKPLGDLLHDESLTLEEALVILARAMEGIAAAHDVGVIHRDIKPDNIFVCIGASGRLDDPRVLDFGISKLDDGVAEQLTRSGVAMGTPYYMSIEQLNGQRDLDARVDVYAMGVILYEAISGAPPYTADSISALAIRVLTTNPVPLGQLRPDLPRGLADVVMKAMAKQRDDRYRSMRQLIEALRPFIPRSAGLPVPEGQGRPLRTPSGPKTPQHSAVLTRGAHEGDAAEAYAPTARGSRVMRMLAVVLAVLSVTGAAALFLRERLGPATPTSPLAAPESEQSDPSGAAAGGGAKEAPLQAASRERRAPAEDAPRDPEQPAERPQREADPPVERAAPSAPSAPSPSEREPRAKASAAFARVRAKRARAEPAVKAVEPAAEPPAIAPAPPPPAAASQAPLPARKSAEGRAGKLESGEF